MDKLLPIPDTSLDTEVKATMQGVQIDQIVHAEISEMTLFALEKAVNGDIQGAIEAESEKYNNDVNQIFNDKSLENDEFFEKFTALEAKKARNIEVLMEFGGFASDQVVEQPKDTSITTDLLVETSETIPEENYETEPTIEQEQIDKKFAEIVENSFDLEPEELNEILLPIAADSESATKIETQPENFGGFEELLDDPNDPVDVKPGTEYRPDIEKRVKNADLANDKLSYEVLEDDPLLETVIAENGVEEPDLEEFKESLETKNPSTTLNATEAFLIAEALNDCKVELNDAEIYINNGDQVANNLEKFLKKQKVNLRNIDDSTVETLTKFFDTVEKYDDTTEILEFIPENTPYDLMYDFVDFIGDIDKQLIESKRSWKVVRDNVMSMFISETDNEIKQEDVRLTPNTVITPTIASDSKEIEHLNTQDLQIEISNAAGTLIFGNEEQGKTVSFDTLDKVGKVENIDITPTALELLESAKISVNTKEKSFTQENAILVYMVAKKAAEGKKLSKNEIDLLQQYINQTISPEENSQKLHESKQHLDADDSTVDDSQFTIAA